MYGIFVHLILARAQDTETSKNCNCASPACLSTFLNTHVHHANPILNLQIQVFRHMMASCTKEPLQFCGLGVHEAYGTFMPAFYAIHSSTVKPAVDPHMQQLQVPRLGVYGDSYDLASPILFVQTTVDYGDAEETGRAKLPALVQAAVEGLLPAAAATIPMSAEATFPSEAPATETPTAHARVRVYVLLQSVLERRECVHFCCTRRDEVSFVPHLVLFGGSNLTGPALHHVVHMGAFCGHGVDATHQDLASLHDRGLTIDSLSERAVSVHDSCFSPANAQIGINGDCDLVSFITVCHLPSDAPGQRSAFFGVGDAEATGDHVAVTLHMLPATEKAETQCMHWTQKHSANIVEASRADMQDALPCLSKLFSADTVADAVKEGVLPSGMEHAAQLARLLLQLD